jgi:hypothetical protein
MAYFFDSLYSNLLTTLKILFTHTHQRILESNLLT